MTRVFMVGVWSLLFAVGCDGVQGPGYPGEPLARIQGRITATDDVDATRGVRLALVWFATLGNDGEPLNRPKSIVTEDIVYRGSFPVNYEFNLYKPPPRDALGILQGDGATASAAFGVLLAYVDENGNGQLDTIPRGGEAVDTVLGTSWKFLDGNGYGLIYLDQSTPLSLKPNVQLEPGFNLIGATHTAPLSTLVPIALTASPELNIYVCEELWEPAQNAESPCWLYIPDVPAVGAALTLEDARADVMVSVWDRKANQPVRGALVKLDGREVPENDLGWYELHDPTATLLAPGGSYRIEVRWPGGSAPTELIATMPGDFAITAPAANASLTSGAPVDIRWTPSAGADHYKVSLNEDVSNISLFGPERSDDEELMSSPISYSGNARVEIEAIRGEGLTSTLTVLKRSVPVSFAR